MELKRWPVILPLFPHLVAAVKAGHGRDVLEFFLKRIYERDGEVNAVVESYAPSVIGVVSSKARPFEGLPILVKDNLDVEGFHTVCGSSLFINDPVAVRDSKFVATLRALGAIPVGKTNVPAFGMDIQTFNDVYGTTNNPYNLQLTVGGSSGGNLCVWVNSEGHRADHEAVTVSTNSLVTWSNVAGSAAAVAMGMSPFAVGSDLNGSLRIPASFCGVCSFHATRGRMTVHQQDIFPPSHPSVDADVLGFILTEGLFTTNVSDLQFCTQPLLQRSVNETQDAFVGRLSPKQGQGISLGVVTSYSGMLLDHRIESAMKKIPLWLDEASQKGRRMKVVAKMAENFVLDGKTTHKATRILGDAIATKEYDLTKLQEARSIQASSSAAVEAFFETTGFSAIIMPVCAVLPPEHNPEHNPVLVNNVSVPYFIAMCGYVEPVKISGNPIVTMPLCLIDGQPCGIQVVGRRGCDVELLRICVELERHLACAESCHTHPLKFPTPADFPY